MSRKHAVVSLSGGMDSSTLLLRALKEYDTVTGISFDYGQKHKVELWLMYDVESLGQWKYSKLSENLLIKHIQWSEDGYHKYMSQADIGVVPSLMPIKNISLVKKISKSIFNVLNENFSDYFLRFKVTSNVGRGLVFAQLKVPVIMDMTPSALQFVWEPETVQVQLLLVFQYPVEQFS